MDQTCALTFVAHGFYGIEAMIGDYVPLIAPLFIAKVNLMASLTTHGQSVPLILLEIMTFIICKSYFSSFKSSGFCFVL